MKKFIAMWLLSSLISFGMLRYYTLERFCYHGTACEEVTNTTAYITDTVATIFGPLSLMAISATIGMLNISSHKLIHSPFGLAFSKNIMWPKHHNHSIAELETPKVKRHIQK